MIQDEALSLSPGGTTLKSLLSQMFDQAPGFIALLREPGHVFELTNAAYQRLIGHRQVVGKSVRDALPELEGNEFFEHLDHVYTTGAPYIGHGVKVGLRNQADGPVEERILDFVYQPIKADDGRITAIFIEGTDVSELSFANAALRLREGPFAIDPGNSAGCNGRHRRTGWDSILQHRCRNVVRLSVR